MSAKQSVETRSRAVSFIAISRTVEIVINGTGLTASQFRALMLVRAGHTSGAVLARFLDVRPPTVTTVMNGLVDEGLVERVRAVDDRRRVDFELTTAGVAALERAEAAADEALAGLAEELETGDRLTAFAGIDLWRQALDQRRTGS